MAVGRVYEQGDYEELRSDHLKHRIVTYRVPQNILYHFPRNIVL